MLLVAGFITFRQSRAYPLVSVFMLSYAIQLLSVTLYLMVKLWEFCQLFIQLCCFKMMFLYSQKKSIAQVLNQVVIVGHPHGFACLFPISSLSSPLICRLSKASCILFYRSPHSQGFTPLEYEMRGHFRAQIPFDAAMQSNIDQLERESDK